MPERTVRVLTGTLALVLLASAMSGCSREGRHDLLTFFFTGVEPLEPEGAEDDEAARERAEASLTREERRAKRIRENQTVVLRTQKWGHGPYAATECELCHATGGSLAFRKDSAQAGGSSLALPGATRRLVAPLQELCFGCHTAKGIDTADASELRLHGPVASGLCIGCHSPHQSTRRYMLRGKDNIELCERCHNLAGIRERSPVHAQNGGQVCTTCHNPHMGRSAMILRSEYDEKRGP
jgi:predicted CXXCH cytochrome family protein